VIIASDERLFTALKYIAASYFCYIAWHGLRAKKPLNTVNDVNVSMLSDEKKPSAKNAFFTGFLINGLNVKATLFFVSVYSVVISPETPFSIKLGYGLYMAVATAIWFVFLSYLLTHHKMRNFLQIKGYLIDRLMGLVLLLLAIQIVASDLS